MKKVLLIIIISLGVVNVANAQEVGKLWLGGAAGVGYTKMKNAGNNTSGFNFQVLPEVGYIVNTNLSVGMAVGYGQFKYDRDVHQAIDQKKFIVKPFVRYSFLRFDRVSVFAEGGLGYEWGKPGKHMNEINTFEAGIRPGLALHLSDKINFITKVGFMGYTYSKQGDAKLHDFGLNVDMEDVLFGVNVFF
ncbi:outer membrane beta-barrel protein [Dysgonomonas sp. 25]|uniref:outer membrane beta-barrel protein n=1 Tax=Dysgonomonas sp. 25 TaxID=2302933 RepID=UPI0013D80425|nr:outer membrane beta-barrel protein [Dysgonomonas sp. 25]NDV70069.1 hypothetical protein [Dysgonomonas sp. 25]